ncbi:MAG TPA: hypothetical protein VFT27_04550 [Actinomycetota bacterium]|nr:hypothetical protein [Actinomycetota bacterium]
MVVDAVRDRVEKELADTDGILRLEPAWVGRDLLPSGRRLGLTDDAYDLGERGEMCERWLASTTHADNRIGPPDEGLSYLALDGSDRITLKDAVEMAPATIMGAEYAATHASLSRLAKIFDYRGRLPLHLHQRQEHAALVGRHSKDEAYYFPPGVDLGPHPETFLGVHPSLAEDGDHEVLLPYLEDWDSDLILRHSIAYVQVPEEGFHVPSGVLHGPGTALTIELQEDSDVFAMLQALNHGKLISKELLWKDVSKEDREGKGERFILELIDWQENGDAYLYENHHLSPQPIEDSRTSSGEEHWIYYNTTKFSGKKLVVRPGRSYVTVDEGVYNILVWSGSGTYGGVEVEGGTPGLDELLVAHDRAVAGVEVRNTGTDDLFVIKFFGPDVNADVPMIERR